MDQEPRAKLDNPRWLTLSEAAQRLGVHPSTVRRWTDSGDLLCARTPGGHRRFLAEHLDAFLRSYQEAAVATSPDALRETLIRVTLHHIDRENVSGKAWHAAFNEPERAVRRESGRRLLGLAIRYTSRNTERDVALREGQQIGWQYGQDAAKRGLSLADTAQAFLFFRDMLVRATQSSPSIPHDAEDIPIRRNLLGFTDGVFSAAMDAYEQTLRHMLGSESIR